MGGVIREVQKGTQFRAPEPPIPLHRPADAEEPKRGSHLALGNWSHFNGLPKVKVEGEQPSPDTELRSIDDALLGG